MRSKSAQFSNLGTN